MKNVSVNVGLVKSKTFVVCATVLSLVALFNTAIADVNYCNDGESYTCNYVLDELEIQKVPATFNFQSRISQAKIPVGDATLPQVSVLILRGSEPVCEEYFYNVKVRDSVLNLEIGRGMNCREGNLEDEIAINPALKFRVCLGDNDNCLRVVEMGSVPYSMKSTYSVLSEKSRKSDEAAMAHYAHRVTADKNLFVSSDAVPTNGYFDFYTPTSDSNENLYYVDENCDPYLSSCYGNYYSYQNSGFIQWAPITEEYKNTDPLVDEFGETVAGETYIGTLNVCSLDPDKKVADDDGAKGQKHLEEFIVNSYTTRIRGDVNYSYDNENEEMSYVRNSGGNLVVEGNMDIGGGHFNISKNHPLYISEAICIPETLQGDTSELGPEFDGKQNCGTQVDEETITNTEMIIYSDVEFRGEVKLNTPISATSSVDTDNIRDLYVFGQENGSHEGPGDIAIGTITGGCSGTTVSGNIAKETITNCNIVPETIEGSSIHHSTITGGAEGFDNTAPLHSLGNIAVETITGAGNDGLLEPPFDTLGLINRGNIAPDTITGYNVKNKSIYGEYQCDDDGTDCENGMGDSDLGYYTIGALNIQPDAINSFHIQQESIYGAHKDGCENEDNSDIAEGTIGGYNIKNGSITGADMNVKPFMLVVDSDSKDDTSICSNNPDPNTDNLCVTETPQDITFSFCSLISQEVKATGATCSIGFMQNSIYNNSNEWLDNMDYTTDPNEDTLNIVNSKSKWRATAKDAKCVFLCF